MHEWIRSLTSAAAVLLISAATTADGPTAVRAHEDLALGYSIRPPSSSPRTVGGVTSWEGIDPRTKAVTWTFTVRPGPGRKGVAFDQQATDLLKRLRANPAFAVTSANYITLAGRKSLDVRGQTLKPLKLWQRQVYVPRTEQSLLVVTMTGPTADETKLLGICDEALATLRILDARQVQARQAAAMERGKAFLAAMTDRKIATVTDAEPQWFLLRIQGKTAGFMRVTAVARGKGVLVTTVAVTARGRARRITCRRMYSDASGRREWWDETVRDGGKLTGTKFVRRQGDHLVWEVTAGGKTVSRKTPVAPVHLPYAFGWLLPRMLDLANPTSYAFGGASMHGPPPREVITVGPAETPAYRGRKVTVVRIDSELIEGRAVNRYTRWTTLDGHLVRMRMPMGVQIDVASQQAVAKQFPDAAETIGGAIKKLAPRG